MYRAEAFKVIVCVVKDEELLTVNGLPETGEFHVVLSADTSTVTCGAVVPPPPLLLCQVTATEEPEFNKLPPVRSSTK